MLSKLKKYFSDIKHIINIILVILALNTIINILSGVGGIVPTIIPLLYFCFIRFGKNIKFSIWNMVFFIWVILKMIVVFITPTNIPTIISSILMFLYLLFINIRNRFNILNKKNLSIVFLITVIGLVFSCCIDIRYFFTTKFGLTGLGYLSAKIGVSNTINMVITFNVISVVLNFIYQLFVIIYFKQYANYRITKSIKNEK